MLTSTNFLEAINAMHSFIDLLHLVIVVVQGGVVGLEIIRYKREVKK